jgi:thymidylate kinase
MVLDVPVDLGLRRKAGGEGADRIEKEGADFLTRVREGYLELVAREPASCVIDAGGTPEAVQASIRAVLEEAFPETFSGKGVLRGDRHCGVTGGDSALRTDGSS